MNTTGDVAKAKPPIRLRTLSAPKPTPANHAVLAERLRSAASQAALAAPRGKRGMTTSKASAKLPLQPSPMAKAKRASRAELAELPSDVSSEASASSTTSGDSDDADYSEDDETATLDSAPQVATRNHSAVCAYEKQRLLKMQQNAAYLATLGLASTKTSLRDAAKVVPAKPARKRPPTAPALPTRTYALRRRTLPGASSVNEPSPSPPPSPQATYEDSSVHKYMCSLAPNAARQGDASASSTATLVFQTVAAHDRMDAHLKKIYSMDMSTPGLLATGGHLGFVSVYGADVVASGAAPLQSFRAHGGWVSSVRLFATASASLLVTASNDSYVKVWDLHQTNSNDGCPKEVTATNELHRSGIFSLDLSHDSQVDARLVTSSKDQSVVLSRLTPAGIVQTEATYQDHAGVVKCVRLARHDRNVFASCGNDRAVYIRDTRSPAAAPLALAELHTQAVNCVRWHPQRETQLLTSGFDGQLFLVDTRQPKAPVQTFAVPTTTRLFNPEFVAGGYIAVCLEKTLTLYCTQSGAVFSRGSMEYDGDSILVTPSQSILVAHKHIVSLYASD
ncbi:hypothetical protein SDRG_00953 [Saprolegnia diclina VS20]|uniref:Uncharacterized protein n=1 Tax=Saprolegnia diclina (strain VS20) TaxID=1156394 RepID=T0SGQ0_SAPDV|nr:hypothetical protein SDRG_00953 [Saprolegnia diclina VS20]EQC42112.1 hypothetical protein SDRG_00953 [Saprolegnia diclina VS20]|eukprot:XP_008604681.1 hypothetical protein SDRG_00953 [Saprolegnia diclina VS20]